MKTYKNLCPQIASFSSLYQAWPKARRGKRYKPAASAFECNLDAELAALHAGGIREPDIPAHSRTAERATIQQRRLFW